MQILRRFFLWLVMVGSFSGVLVVKAQTDLPVLEPNVEYTFGREIVFQISIQSETPVQELRVFFQVQGDPTYTIDGVADLDEGGTAVYIHDVSERYVPAFSTIEYWFLIKLADQRIIPTERFTFFYEDNQYDWQVLESPPFRVHWYDGEASLAQFILDTAQLGMQKSQAILKTRPPERVDIYAYANNQDYQKTIPLLPSAWTGGHASPEAGLILFSLPVGAEKRLEVERKVPHEVAHIMLYQASEDGYGNIPTWLNEGFATMMELNPNPDFLVLLDNAFQNESLLPLATLCEPFPTDASGILLSYAESTSFVRFIEGTYGPLGLNAVVQEYARGASCENGSLVAPVNQTLSDLERDWRRVALSEEPASFAAEPDAFVPWLVLASAILIGPGILLLGTMWSRRHG